MLDHSDPGIARKIGLLNHGSIVAQALLNAVDLRQQEGNIEVCLDNINRHRFREISLRSPNSQDLGVRRAGRKHKRTQNCQKSKSAHHRPLLHWHQSYDPLRPSQSRMTKSKTGL